MASSTPPIQPIRPAYHTKILADDQLQTLKHGTLEIIAEVGVHCPSQKALEIYADHGAVVDFDTKIVQLPHDLVLPMPAACSLNEVLSYCFLFDRTI